MSLDSQASMRALRISIPVIAIMALATSFASMSYELVIAQAISILTDEVIWWESCTIGTFIAATGVGIFLFEGLAKKDYVPIFLQAEFLLAIVGLLALPLTLFIHIVYRIYIVDYAPHDQLFSPLNWVMLACQCPTILIGLLSGLELSALLKIAGLANARMQTLVIAVYHLGALLAAMVFAGLSLAKVDSFELAFSAALLNMMIFFYLLWKRGFLGASSLKSKLELLLASAALLTSSLIAHSGWDFLKTLQIQNFYYNNLRMESLGDVYTQTGPVGLTGLLAWQKKFPKVERKVSSYQVIDIVDDEKTPYEWKLFLDGHFQFSYSTERFYHETLAHVPVMMTGKVPKKVLVLGGGDGLLVRELLKYGDRVDRIDLIELDKAMIELAKTSPFVELNEDSFLNPKVHISIADAFSWLRMNTAKYDAIYIDFPYPYTYEGLRLYSAEFLHQVARNLQPEGFVVMDIPIYEAGAVGWEGHVQSLLSKAGFAKSVAIQGSYAEFFVMALKREQSLSSSYLDLGIPLVTLNKDWFSATDNAIELKPGSLQSVNSVLKPKRISVRDVWK